MLKVASPKRSTNFRRPRTDFTGEDVLSVLTDVLSVLTDVLSVLICVLMDSHGRPVCADGHTQTHT